jgi:creatinine amidohydrolase/Fe(II)-dependent formamide hydrolase-like protein
MRRLAILTSISFFLLPLVAVSVQRPANAPPTAPAAKPPDSVFIEELTWAEVRDLSKAGTTTVIIPTAGTEQKGPHMVEGEHRYIMEYTADKIARSLGKTLVAPVITYVPEGSWENPTGHMSKAGTITLPDDRFIELLAAAGRSVKAGGFKDILFIGDSGGNRTGMKTAAAKLNELWKGKDARAFWIDDYYTKAEADQEKYITEKLGIPHDQIGGHANIMSTSEMLFVNPRHVRKNKLAPGGGYENSGVSGDPSKSTPELGKIFLQIKIDNALAQIRNLMGGRTQAAESRAVPLTPPAVKTPAQTLDTVFIEEMTWEEIRDAIKAGKTTVIVPTGGTEKNGYHMIAGKHNYVVTYTANLIAQRLKNALVAPTIQYVPEGDPDESVPGEISLPSPAYDMLLDAAARSLKVHGFKEILFIGDSGGNQAGMTNVANKLNAEWKATDVKVFALTGYYNDSRVYHRAWLQAAYGYDPETVGNHAGISDTSQLMFIRPAGIRKDQIKPWGSPQDSGVSGDPSKATPEIGKMGVEFKVNAAINQYKLLKSPPQRGGRGGPG